MKAYLLILILLSASLLRGETEVKGTTMAWERTTVSSPVEEIVREVFVTEGQTVKKGDILAQLLVRKQELEVRRLEQLIKKATFVYEATVELAKEKIESQETLLEKKAELDSLLIAKELADVAVEERKIVAPVAGAIVHRLKDPGESVERVGPMFEIIDVSRLKLLFFLPVEHLSKLKEGMEVQIKFPDAPEKGAHKAVLTFIDPQVDARSGLFRARFEFDNSEVRIKPGVRVYANLPDTL